VTARGAERPDKRRAILTAAFRRFAQYGYRRTSLEDIAREAGISRAAVYLQFRNKEDLFRALSRDLQETALSSAEAAARLDGSFLERIERILEAKLGQFHDIVYRSAHAGELLDENNRICGDISAEARRRYQKLIRRLIDEGVRRGELAPHRVGLAAGSAAELIVDCARALETAGAAERSPALYRRRLSELARVLVVGLGGTPPSGGQHAKPA